MITLRINGEARAVDAPGDDTLRLLRHVVAPQLAEVYPQFAAAVFGAAAP